MTSTALTSCRNVSWRENHRCAVFWRFWRVTDTRKRRKGWWLDPPQRGPLGGQVGSTCLPHRSNSKLNRHTTRIFGTWKCGGLKLSYFYQSAAGWKKKKKNPSETLVLVKYSKKKAEYVRSAVLSDVYKEHAAVRAPPCLLRGCLTCTVFGGGYSYSPTQARVLEKS